MKLKCTYKICDNQYQNDADTWFSVVTNDVRCPVCHMVDCASRDRKHSRQFDVTIGLLSSKINIYGMCSKNLNRKEFLSIAAQLFSRRCIVYCDKERMNAVVRIWGVFFSEWMVTQIVDVTHSMNSQMFSNFYLFASLAASSSSICYIVNIKWNFVIY